MRIGETSRLLLWITSLWLNIAMGIPRSILQLVLYGIKRSLDRKPEEDTIFIGGAFSFPIGNMLYDTYWCSGDKVCWAPRIGPVSSPEDGARELFASLRGSNHETLPYSFITRIYMFIVHLFSGIEYDNIGRPPILSSKSKINVITHSNGFVWAGQLLIYLHQHKIGMMKEKMSRGVELTSGELSLLGKIRDIDSSEYKILFYDNDREPIDVGPDVFRKMCFVVPPAGGIEFMRSFLDTLDDFSFNKFGAGWLIAQLSSRWNSSATYLSGKEGIHTGWIEPLARKRTDMIMEIAELYNIPVTRVIGESSTNMFGLHLTRPFCSLSVTLSTMFGCGRVLDSDRYGDLYSQELSSHDGVISTRSQLYGVKCSCRDSPKKEDVVTCDTCGTIYTTLDHTGIISGTGDAVEIHQKIFDWISK